MKSPDYVKEWLQALEAERFDLSYRRRRNQELEEPKAKRKRETPIINKPARPTIEEITERTRRDRLIYNAGRYAGGARDTEAVQAFQRLHKRKGTN